ncbi:MAG: hypothetical protein JRH15_21865 [Deltaproteobacteria bacterium]|nr:hypothetical protein [Deltaproteobacteria bacterium]
MLNENVHDKPQNESMQERSFRDRVRATLESKPRDLLLFDTITHTDIKIKVLLTLKVKNLEGVKPGDQITLGRLDKDLVTLALGPEVYESFLFYLEKFKPDSDDFLFKSRKGSKPLTSSSVSSIVKKMVSRCRFPRNGGDKISSKFKKNITTRPF